MKIRFIYPRFEKLVESRAELASLAEIKGVGNFRMPPALGIPILAALTPEDIKIELFDENIEPINYNEDADVIAVSFFTPQAEYAYSVAKKFKAKGKTVIAGGMHPTVIPEEAAEYFDSVCIGEAEEIWLTILSDIKNKMLKKYYYGGYPDLSTLPIPRRNIFKNKSGYEWDGTLVQVSRGCANNCEGCIIPVESGKEYRFRSVQNVIKDIETIGSMDFFFTDDPLVLPNQQCKKYLLQLLEETKKLQPKPRIFLSGSLNISIEKEYLNNLYEGGVVCLYIVFGCDPFSINAFRPGGHKFFNWSLDIVKRIQDSGIHVFTSFGLGFDYQDKSVFDLSLEFAGKANIKTAEFYILTPFPKTPSWFRFIKENRILHYNWSKYNSANVVFKPKNFTDMELLEGYLYCWKEFYKNRLIDSSIDIFKP
ncbi:MAG: cobalamin B12-binding domain-containing protein [Bacteroidia bacterium]|nr:cobalamin B12-binding domain-containing protein [Bacteroidia bacterium]